MTLPIPLSVAERQKIATILEQFPLIALVVKELHQRGACAYLVGGIVRDIVLGSLQPLPVGDASGGDVDIDIEVHGISLEDLGTILSTFGAVNYVGKSFGVLKVGSTDIDWVVPRTDSAGRKPQVTMSIAMPLKDALRRRDLTMNAMAIDLHEFLLHDPFGGLADIKNKVLRSPDVTFFTQDPLRFYRIMQFIGRFEMYPDEALQNVCATMDIAQISRERIEMEFNKLFLKSRAPSKGVAWLSAVGRLNEVMPELAQLRGVEQDPIWHPEGDVFEHTLQALDAAAQLHYESTSEKLLIMYAALCHDLGKKIAQQRENERIHNYGHDHAGAPIAKKLLQRLSTNKKLIEEVYTLVYYHMAPLQLVANKAGLGAYKRLAKKIAPLSLRLLALLCDADTRGRNPARGTPLTTSASTVTEFIARAQQAGVYEQPEAPILVGADLLAEIPAGPELGTALAKAYEIQINEGITDKAELKKRVLGR